MPELPELEALRLHLNNKLSFKTITSASVFDSHSLQNVTVKEFKEKLHDKLVMSVTRYGKFIIFNFADESKMLIHLVLKGELNLFQTEATAYEIVFHLCNGSALHFRDNMHLAKIYYVDMLPFGITGILEKLGPDALSDNFNAKYFKEKLKNESRNIKLVLLDQKIVAGIGNAYASEILFKAGIHPKATAMFLTLDDVCRIVDAVKSVLQEATAECIKACNQCSCIRLFEPEARRKLAVFLRKGKHCPVCGSVIQNVNIAARSTYFCPTCQNTKGVHLS